MACMSQTLRDFIAKRETEIRDQQKALKAELRELQAAKAAIDATPQTGATGQAVTGAVTIKDMARDVLHQHPDGLNSAGILAGIKTMFDRDVERTSLSPQLSRLKDDGALVLSGELWFTKDHWDAQQKQMFEDAAKALEIHASKMPEERPSAPWDEKELDEWGSRPSPELEEEPPF